MTDLATAKLQRLERFAAIAATGADAKAFLQGQLSYDLERLTPGRMELASCSSAQGRVQAVLWLIERSDSILMVVAAAMLDMTLARLRKYTLRSKVKLEATDQFAVFAADDALVDHTPRTHVEYGDRSYVRWPGGRVLCLAPANAGESDASTSTEWHRADIAAALPQVYPATHEAFVAQMLNLDILGGVSFEKGCYTGQEIIARTHFRGAIKRRMLRFRVEGPPPDPGTRIVAGDQHAGDVVDAIDVGTGAELLAVVNLTHAEAPLRIAASGEGAPLKKLPLPYSLSVDQG
jgi:folate-binding protein YgfZ